MRLLREVPNEQFKIYIYSWNNRYLVKIEQGLLEQTYKISEWDVLSEEHLNEIIDKLATDASDIFISMRKHLSEAVES